MSRPRAWALACGASYGRKFWTFQSTLAKFTGFCVRTIQRAFRQAKKLGILFSKRIKRGETAPGGRGPLTCGAALRTIVGWGMPEAQAMALRLRYAVREEFRRAELAAAVAEFRSLAPP
jgi:hypothetical protein